MAIPSGLHLDPKDSKDSHSLLVEQLRKIQEQSSENANHVQEGLKKSLDRVSNRISVDTEQRKKDYLWFTQVVEARLKKEDATTDAMVALIKANHRIMESVQQNNDAMIDVIMSPEARRYRKDEGKKIAKDYSRKSQILSDKNFFGSLIDHYKKQLTATKDAVTSPGSRGALWKSDAGKLRAAEESKEQDVIMGSILENQEVGRGKEYTDMLSKISQGKIERATAVRDAMEAQRNAKGQFAKGNTQWRRNAGEGEATGGKRLGSEEARGIFGDLMGDNDDTFKKKSPIKPTKAFVANLPAAFGAGSLLIAGMLEDASSAATAKGGAGGKGGAIEGGIMGAIGAFLMNLLKGALPFLKGGLVISALSALTAFIGKLQADEQVKGLAKAKDVEGQKLLGEMVKDLPFMKAHNIDANKIASGAYGYKNLMGIGDLYWKYRFPGHPDSTFFIDKPGDIQGQIPSPQPAAATSTNLNKLKTEAPEPAVPPWYAKQGEQDAYKKLHDIWLALKENTDVTKKGVEAATVTPSKLIPQPTAGKVQTP